MITAGLVALRCASERGFAGDTPISFVGRDGVAQFRRLGGAGALDGVGQHHGRIVAERGHGIGRFAVVLAP